MKKGLLIVFSVFLFLALVSAQDLAIDIDIGKQIYSIGENVSYEVLLLDNSLPVNEEVKVFISDISEKKTLDFLVKANEKQNFNLEKDFASGYWKIEASYKDKTVKRFFTIGEREEADFSIDGEQLIIRNTGNVPYTKNIQILIGEKVISQKQYIEIGDYKTIKLVAPEGNYNIQVTDGVKSISKSDIYLAGTGTGQVIGALDEKLVDSPPALGGVRDASDESFFTTKNFSVAFIFIGAVFGLFLLMLVEKVMRKKRASGAQSMVRLH